MLLVCSETNCWRAGREVSWTDKPLMRPSLPSSSFHSISLVFSLKRYMAIPQITIYLSFLHFPPVPAALFLLFTLLLLAWALCTLLFFIHHMVDFWIGRYSHVTSTWDFVSLQQRGRLCNWTSLPSQSPLAFTYRVVYCLFSPALSFWISREILSWNISAAAFHCCPGELRVVCTM